MSDKFSRFRHLEPPAAPGTRPDFAARRKADLRSGVELDTEHDADQPFLRCPYCEADNAKFAPKCLNCAHELQTDEVRGWNAAFWAEQRAQLVEEQAKGKAVEERKLAEAQAAAAEHTRAAQEQNARAQVTFGARLLETFDPELRVWMVRGLVGLAIAAVYAALRPQHGLVPRAVGVLVLCALAALFGASPRNPPRDG